MTETILSGVTFYYNVSSENSTKTLTSSSVLNLPKPVFRVESCYMEIADPSDPEIPSAVFILSANLKSSKCRSKSSQLKLYTGMPNTYAVSLSAKFPNSGISDVPLIGYHTAAVRKDARTYLLAGIGTGEFTESVEEMRTKVLQTFSHKLLNRLFVSNPTLISTNSVLINTWLIKLLG
jgi:hypothetical protein